MTRYAIVVFMNGDSDLVSVRGAEVNEDVFEWTCEEHELNARQRYLLDTAHQRVHDDLAEGKS